MGMLVVTALVTFFVQRQELWSIGKKAAVKMAGTAVVDVLAPGLHYEEKENGNHFLAKVEKILFPIADYTVQIQSYEQNENFLGIFNAASRQKITESNS